MSRLKRVPTGAVGGGQAQRADEAVFSKELYREQGKTRKSPEHTAVSPGAQI